jgi:hypothetical protein
VPYLSVRSGLTAACKSTATRARTEACAPRKFSTGLIRVTTPLTDCARAPLEPSSSPSSPLTGSSALATLFDRFAIAGLAWILLRSKARMSCSTVKMSSSADRLQPSRER